MNRVFLYLLRNLYAKLDIKLINEKNICSNCYKCCTAAARQRVSAIEKEYIKEYLKEKGFPVNLIEDYEKFLDDRKNLYDRCAVNILCPFYDTEKKGCFIYPARPYSCRIYGNFSMNRDDLPKECSYRKITKIYSDKDLLKIVPYSEDYASIGSAYTVYIKYTGYLVRIFYKI
jgi:uncharacterized protein